MITNNGAWRLCGSAQNRHLHKSGRHANDLCQADAEPCGDGLALAHSGGTGSPRRTGVKGAGKHHERTL
jgi:hypothetical protein